MSKATLRFRVDRSDLRRLIRGMKRGIADGMRDSRDDLLDIGERRAKDVIRTHDRIWNKELYHAFTQTKSSSAAGAKVSGRLANTSPHAAPVEHGADYGARGPPVAALIPWVEDNLQGWDLGGSGGSGGAASAIRRTEEREIADEIAESLPDNGFTPTGPADGDPPHFQALRDHPDLDEDKVDEIIGLIRNWKGGGSGDRIAAINKQTLNIERPSRGDKILDVPGGPPEPITEEHRKVVRVLHHLGPAAMGSDEVRLHRGLRHYDTASMMTAIFNEWDADSWDWENRAIENSTPIKGVAEQFSEGLSVDLGTVNVRDDVVIAPDFLIPDHYAPHEHEVWVRGDRFGEVPRGDVSLLTGVDRQNRRLKSLDGVLSRIDSDGWSSLSDDELWGFYLGFRAMDSHRLHVGNAEARQRLDDFADVFIARGLHKRTSMDDAVSFRSFIRGLQ